MTGLSRSRLGLTGLARLLWREARGNRSRLIFFVLCLSVGVGAVVAVKAVSSSLEQGVRAQARELIAADLLVSARRTPDQPLDGVFEELNDRFPGLRTAPVLETLSVVASQRDVLAGSALPGLPPQAAAIGASQVTELKAVSPGYPFYGEVETEPAGAIDLLFDEALDPGVLVAPELLSRLELDVGDVLLVGGTPFRIQGVVRAEPDRVGGGLSIAPRTLVSMAALERTSAVNRASRASYAIQVQVPNTVDVDAVAAALKAELPKTSRLTVETYREARPQLREALDRVAAFLSLVALLSLLIGGVGVSQTVRAWLVTRWDQIAILKSVGLLPREVLVLYLSQVVLLAAVGSAVGATLGVWLQLLVPRLFGDFIPADMIRAWQPWPMAQGFLLGVAVALAFSVPPLLTVLRVPAARVLRRDSEPLANSGRVNAALAALVVAVVFVVASTQAVGLPLNAFLVGGSFTGLLIVTVLCLMLAAWAVIKIFGRRQNRSSSNAWRLAVSYGASAVARPGAGTLSAIVALGLGILVVLTMVLVEGALTDQLEADLPDDAPSMFLMGIEDRQWPALSAVLESAGRRSPPTQSGATAGEQGEASGPSRSIRSVAVLNTLVESIEGEPIEQRLANAATDSRRWATRRQLQVAPLEELPTNNSLVRGEWFSDDGRWEASIEREYAENLGVDVGSTLVLRVGNERREFTVTSLREIDWESFSINFWVAIESGAFATDSVFRMATVRALDAEEQAIQDTTVAQFPNVTVIRVREALDRVIEIFSRLSLGIKLLGGFTVLAGLVILGGSVAASAARRGREVALLKSLGMLRSQVVLAFGTEYAMLGLVASVIATAGATLVSWVASRFLFEIDWTFRPGTVVLAIAAGVLLAILGGTLASLGALRRRPIESLRSGV